jgi:hypothetical protein
VFWASRFGGTRTIGALHRLASRCSLQHLAPFGRFGASASIALARFASTLATKKAFADTVAKAFLFTSY